MLPSSNSGLSAYSGQSRPSSSLSNHTRPHSSASTTRPSSSSARPISSHSTRPGSRSSYFRHARSRLTPFCQELVTRITGLRDSDDARATSDFRTAVEFAVKNLEATAMAAKAAASVDMRAVSGRIRGHAMKARVNSQDELGQALEDAFKTLEAQIDKQDDLDKEIKKSRLPDHLQFLLALSAQPTPHTLTYAHKYLHTLAHPPAPPMALTWADILAAEPFEGAHWDGVYGLPPGAVRHPTSSGSEGKRDGFYDREKESQRIDWDARWSTPSLSPLNSGDLELDESSESESSFSLTSPSRPKPEFEFAGKKGLLEGSGGSGEQEQGRRAPSHTYEHRKEYETLVGRQYWRSEWRGEDDGPSDGRLNLGDASTLGPALRKILALPLNSIPTSSSVSVGNNSSEQMLASMPGIVLDAFLQNDQRHINEDDAVREVLIALQGRKNVMIAMSSNDVSDKDGGEATGDYSAVPSPRTLRHLSLAAQASVLRPLANTAYTAQRLRQSAYRVFAACYPAPSTAAPSNQNREYGHAHHYTMKKPTTTRTLEAFADAVATEVRALDAWCARGEEALCRARGGALAGRGDGDGSGPNFGLDIGLLGDGLLASGGDRGGLVVSLLRMEKDVRDAFGRTFEVLLSTGQEVYPDFFGSEDDECDSSDARAKQGGKGRPALAAVVSTALLDRLFARVQENLERRERATSDALMRVFVRSAEPLWSMVGRWLRDGMGLGVGAGGEASSGVGITRKGAGELEEEFFIESSGLGVGMMGMGLLDPEYWEEGYALREVGDFGEGWEKGRRRRTVPMFLEHVAEPVLGAGKAVGLLRALGVPPGVGKAEGPEWKSFAKLVNSLSSEARGVEGDMERGLSQHKGRSEQGAGETLFSVSVDTLERIIYDGLLPHCEAMGVLLARVLVEDCELWTHLSTIEDLFLLRRGDAMSHFTDVLFAKMDAQQSWGDFHFLNTAFNDVVGASTNAGANEWVQASLVRLSYRMGGAKDRDKTIARTVKALDGLLVEYAVPFPLTYIFQPCTVQTYGEILVFLLQIRRAKNVLERILVRDAGGKGKRLGAERKIFYATRSRLSWFINTLLNFLTTYVIHTQVVKFREAFRAAKSLDEMIQLHNDHLDKVQGRCLLKPNTSALHRAILSILDMSLHFSDLFVAFAGDTTITHDVSRQSITMRRHRSRRQRRQRRNIIGFSQSLQESHDSSDDDDDDSFDAENARDAPEPSFSMTSSSISEEGFHPRLDKMAAELDGLVRFVRRGVESLAGGTGEAAPAFGVLAFALEDWDN